jgi:hypothetical protein
MIIKCYDNVKHHLEVMMFNRRVNKIIKKFYKRNFITFETTKSERYLDDFRNKLVFFLKRIQKEENGKEILELTVNMLKEHYRYYSKESFDGFYNFTFDKVREFYTESFGDIKDCKFSSILNKDPYVYNSSEHMLSIFADKLEIHNQLIDSVIKKIFTIEYNLSTLQNNISEQRLKISNDLREFIINKTNRKRIANKINDAHKKLEETLSNYYRVEDEIRIRKRKTKAIFKEIKFLVLLDDFSGSGETIIDYLSILQNYLPPTVRVLIFCLHGMYDAEQNLIEWSRNNEISNVTFTFMNLEKKFFDELEFPIQNAQTKLEDFEENSVLDEEEKEKKYILGYDNTQALVTNYRNTPNNTFSIFWKKSENKKWKPLFPRNEKYTTKEYNQFDNPQRTFIRQNVRDYYKKNPINYPEFSDFEMIGIIIFLVYINQNEKKYFTNEDNDVVIELVKDYNSNVLQDCLDHGFLKKSRGHYTFSELGLELLNNLELSNSSLESLSESIVFEAEDRLTPGSDYRPEISS